MGIVQSRFMHDYCRTVHSYQGATIDEQVTAYDWNLAYVSKYWLWTLITRVRSLDNIYFYINPHGSCKLNYQLVNDYLKSKIHRYKLQDFKANREIDDSIPYVDVKCVSEASGNCCHCCGNTLSYDIVEGTVTSNLTADRVDNSLPHYVSNIQYMCIGCNKSKSKR